MFSITGRVIIIIVDLTRANHKLINLLSLEQIVSQNSLLFKIIPIEVKI